MEQQSFFGFLRTASFWVGLAVAIAVLWALEAYVPAFGALTGMWDFIADVLVIIIIAGIAEQVYKKIKK